MGKEIDTYYSSKWNTAYNGFLDMNASAIIEDLLSDMWEDDDTSPKKKGKNMKRCSVTMPDGNDKITVARGCIFIAPTTTGFMLYTNPEGAIEIHCFSDVDSMLAYLNDHKPLDQTQTMIAENI